MKTIITLEEADIAAIFSDHGLRLTLANGQSIDIQAPAEFTPLRNASPVLLSAAPAPRSARPRIRTAVRRKARRDSYNCGQCDATFRSPQGIGGHMRTHRRASIHKSAGRGKKNGPAMHYEYPCPRSGCGRGYNKQGWLQIHLERDHGAASSPVSA